MTLAGANSCFGRYWDDKVFARGRVAGVQQGPYCRVTAVGTFVRCVVRWRRHVACFVFRGAVNRSRVVFVVRRVRVLGGALVNGVPANRAGCLVGSEGDVTRTAVYFRYCSVRHFKFDYCVLFKDGVDWILCHVIRASAVRVVGLTAQRGDEGCFVLLHYDRGGGDVAKELFRHFRRDVRDEDERRVRLVGSVRFVLACLEQSTRLLCRLASVVRQIVKDYVGFVCVVQALLVRDRAELADVAHFPVNDGQRAISDLNGGANTDYFSCSAKAAGRVNVDRFLYNGNVFRYHDRYPLACRQLGNKQAVLANECGVIFRVSRSLYFFRFLRG